VATRATSSWTLEEDAKLTRAVTNTRKKKYGKENRVDWNAVAALVPGRTLRQCSNRWHDFLDPSIDQATARFGKFLEDEETKLMHAVQTHCGKDWAVIAALVPGRTRKQCSSKWRDMEAKYSTGKARGTVKKAPQPPQQVEDIPARKKQRLEEPFSASTDEAARKIASPDLSVGLSPPAVADDIDVNADSVTGTQLNAGATRATGSWTSEEDAKLTRAVANTSKKRCGKDNKTDWIVIAKLVPGRTNYQCSARWKKYLDPESTFTWAAGGPSPR
jgi:hypothetical protein